MTLTQGKQGHRRRWLSWKTVEDLKQELDPGLTWRAERDKTPGSGSLWWTEVIQEFQEQLQGSQLR